MAHYLLNTDTPTAPDPSIQNIQANRFGYNNAGLLYNVRDKSSYPKIGKRHGFFLAHIYVWVSTRRFSVLFPF